MTGAAGPSERSETHFLTPSTSCTALAEMCDKTASPPPRVLDVSEDDPFHAPRVGAPPTSGILLKRGSSWPHAWRLRRVALRGGIVSHVPLRPEEGGSQLWCCLCHVEALVAQACSAARSLFWRSSGDHESLMLKGAYCLTSETEVVVVDGQFEGHDNCIALFETPVSGMNHPGPATVPSTDLPADRRLWVFSCINPTSREQWVEAIRVSQRLQVLVETSQLVRTEDYCKALRLARMSLKAATCHNAFLRTQLHSPDCGASDFDDGRIVDHFVDAVRERQELEDL